MRYTVTWSQVAQDALTLLWIQAQDRQYVADCSNEAERQLPVDPDTRGTDFYGDRLIVVGDCMWPIASNRTICL